MVNVWKRQVVSDWEVSVQFNYSDLGLRTKLLSAAIEVHTQEGVMVFLLDIDDLLLIGEGTSVDSALENLGQNLKEYIKNYCKIDSDQLNPIRVNNKASNAALAEEIVNLIDPSFSTETRKIKR